MESMAQEQPPIRRTSTQTLKPMPLNPQLLEKSFRRALARCERRQDAQAVQDARNTLRRMGWSQVEASKQIGISTIQLSYVLTGRRKSKRVLTAIQHLPENPTPA